MCIKGLSGGKVEKLDWSLIMEALEWQAMDIDVHFVIKLGATEGFCFGLVSVFKSRIEARLPFKKINLAAAC